MADDTDKDYAIEHAGYMATAATDLLDAINAEALEREFFDEDDEEVEQARQSVSEAMTTLRTRIYEFEKRRDRALASSATSGVQAHVEQDTCSKSSASAFAPIRKDETS